MPTNPNLVDDIFSVNEYIATTLARQKPAPIPGIYRLAFKSAAVAAIIFAAVTILAPFVYDIGWKIGMGWHIDAFKTFCILIGMVLLFFFFSLFTIWPNVKFLRELHQKFMHTPPAAQKIWSYSWRHGIKVCWYAQLTLFLLTLVFPPAALFVMIGMIVLSPLTIATALLTGRYAVRRLLALIEVQKETGV